MCTKATALLDHSPPAAVDVSSLRLIVKEASPSVPPPVVAASYDEQQDIRHGAARGWLDRIIQPHETRRELAAALAIAGNWDFSREFKTGVLQV